MCWTICLQWMPPHEGPKNAEILHNSSRKNTFPSQGMWILWRLVTFTFSVRFCLCTIPHNHEHEKRRSSSLVFTCGPRMATHAFLHAFSCSLRAAFDTLYVYLLYKFGASTTQDSQLNQLNVLKVRWPSVSEIHVSNFQRNRPYHCPIHGQRITARLDFGVKRGKGQATLDSIPGILPTAVRVGTCTQNNPRTHIRIWLTKFLLMMTSPFVGPMRSKTLSTLIAKRLCVSSERCGGPERAWGVVYASPPTTSYIVAKRLVRAVCVYIIIPTAIHVVFLSSCRPNQKTRGPSGRLHSTERTRTLLLRQLQAVAAQCCHASGWFARRAYAGWPTSWRNWRQIRLVFIPAWSAINRWMLKGKG